MPDSLIKKLILGDTEKEKASLAGTISEILVNNNYRIMTLNNVNILAKSDNNGYGIGVRVALRKDEFGRYWITGRTGFDNFKEIKVVTVDG